MHFCWPNSALTGLFYSTKTDLELWSLAKGQFELFLYFNGKVYKLNVNIIACLRNKF